MKTSSNKKGMIQRKRKNIDKEIVLKILTDAII